MKVVVFRIVVLFSHLSQYSVSIIDSSVSDYIPVVYFFEAFFFRFYVNIQRTGHLITRKRAIRKAG